VQDARPYANSGMQSDIPVRRSVIAVKWSQLRADAKKTGSPMLSDCRSPLSGQDRRYPA